MNFLYTFLSASIIDKFESNTKFRKSLKAEKEKLGCSKCGCSRQGLNPLSPGGTFMGQKMVLSSPAPAFKGESYAMAGGIPADQ